MKILQNNEWVEISPREAKNINTLVPIIVSFDGVIRGYEKDSSPLAFFKDNGEFVENVKVGARIKFSDTEESFIITEIVENPLFESYTCHTGFVNCNRLTLDNGQFVLSQKLNDEVMSYSSDQLMNRSDEKVYVAISKNQTFIAKYVTTR